MPDPGFEADIREVGRAELVDILDAALAGHDARERSATPASYTDDLLADTVKLARVKGFAGIALIDHGGSCGILAACMSRATGMICDPRNYDYQPTVGAALADLFARLSRK